MSRRRTGSGRTLLLTALLTAALATVAGPAEADDAASIDHIVVKDHQVEVVVSVPGTEPIDLSAVQVQIDGRATTSTAEDASSSDLQRTAVLAFDTSNSMAGAKFDQAKVAALRYLKVIPANINVGMVTFDNKVNVVSLPTLDRGAMRTAIGNLKLAESTALYPGVIKAVDISGSEGTRNILVLSDGKDTTKTNLDGVVTKVRNSGAKVDVVAIQQAGAGIDALSQIASAGEGVVLSTQDPNALTKAFRDAATALTRQVLVTADVPAGKQLDANIEVSVKAGDQTWSDHAFGPVRQKAKPTPATAVSVPLAAPTSGLSLSPAMLLGATAAISLGLLGVALVFLWGAKPVESSVEEQIGAYGAMGKRRAKPSGVTATASFAGAATAKAHDLLTANKGLEAKIAKRLEGASSSLRPAEWLLVHGAIAMVTALVFLLLSGGNLILLVIGLVLGAVLPWVFLGVKAKRRVKAFQAALPDTLQLMAGSLSAGLSLAQSTDTIVREGTEPITSEFKRVIVESRLGVPLEDAMEGVAERMDSRDFEWVVMAIRIQREVGGNLAELLLTVAATLREREYIRRHVRALSAEGRLSCYVLGGLPPAFLAYLALSKWDYVKPLFTTPIGFVLCGGLVVLLSVGVVWMSKVSKVDI